MQRLLQQNNMRNKFAYQTMSQIISSRKFEKESKRSHLFSLTTESTNSNTGKSIDMKLESFLRKTIFNNEDKLWVLRYIEKKYRLNFSHAFSLSLLNLIIVKNKKIINRYYDSNKKSYFILRGKVSICEKNSLNTSLRNFQSENYQQALSLQGQSGIGKLFDSKDYQNCVIVAENTLILDIDHSNGELQLIQNQCLITNDQKQHFVKKLNLFKELQNINRYYTPFFVAKKYNKGQYIYNIGDESDSLNLIVYGSVQFYSKIHIDNMEQTSTSLGEITKNSYRKKYVEVATQILSTDNFFGEEQILVTSQRKQQAKCISLSCLILQIPIQKVNKLLDYDYFRQNLQIACSHKQLQRQKTISNFLQHLQARKQKQIADHRLKTINFTQLDEGIYNKFNKNETILNLSLKDRKVKILHGNKILQLNCPSKIKPASYSMLEVNKQLYDISLKRYRVFSISERTKLNEQPEQESLSKFADNNLKKMWKVLKIQQILPSEEYKINIQGSDGQKYYRSSLRRQNHLKNNKSYRPKTITSSCRAKTQYVQYLNKIL